MELSSISGKPYGVTWYKELIRRLDLAGTSAPVFLDQVHAFLATAGFEDPEAQMALDRARDLCIELRSVTPKEAPRIMGPGDSVWLPGHSPVSGGTGQFERQIEILAAVPAPPPAIAMHFHVSSYTRGGQYFDMESLGYVGLATWRHNLAAPGLVKLSDLYRPGLVWLTMATASDNCAGVELTHASPPQPAHQGVKVDVVMAEPPASSVRGTVIPELAGSPELSEEPWLGLELTFASEVDVGEFGFEGPIKPLIDAMSPILGRDRRGGPADHRLHDLRIRRASKRDGSVRARFWYCSE